MLEVRGLRVLGTHGVLPEEKTRPQPFEVDLDVAFDTTTACATDALGDTVDYGAVLHAVVAVVEGPPVELLERLAKLIGDAALGVDKRIASVEVVIRKLEPPVPYEIGSAGVRLTVPR